MQATVDELRDAGTPTTTPERIAVLRLHDDVRVRALCARHPNLPAEAVVDLARDQASAVRVAIACRAGVAPDVAAPLFVDPARSVRRAAYRHQRFDARLMVRLMESRVWTPKALERTRMALLGDIELTAKLFAQRRWMWFASSGAFDRGSVKAHAKDMQALLLIARNGHLSHPAALALARSEFPAVQEIVGLRADTIGWRAALLAAIGRSRAAAGVAYQSPSRGPRAILACRPARSVRTANALTTTSSWKLYRWSGKNWFPILHAIATNPSAGQRARRRLLKTAYPGVHDALARRTDLTTAEYGKLSARASVSLTAADNPTTPLPIVRGLLVSSDRYVRSLASVHPALPLAERLKVVDDGDSPKWLLRRGVSSADVPDEVRERVLVWIALGGGSGDPNFDPVMCTGTPGEVGQPRDQAYAATVVGHASLSALWYARALAGRGKGTLPHTDIRSMALDGHPAVREVAAGYNSVASLAFLRDDIEPRVRRRAEQTWAGLAGSPERSVRKRLSTARSSLTSIIMVAVVAAIGVAANSSSTATSPVSSTDVNALLQRIGSPVWEESEPPLASPADCDAGGNRVWIERDSFVVAVTVQSENFLTPVSFHLVTPGLPAQADVEVELSDGDTGTWKVMGAPTGRVDIVIGERPEEFLTVPFDTEIIPTIRDYYGDC